MKKLLILLLLLIVNQGFSQKLYKNFAAKKDSSLWRLNGANIINKNTGNVGIGTNTPTQKLEVIGTTKTNNLQITTPSTANSASPFFYAVLDANGNVLKEPIVSTLSPVLNNTITTPPTTPSVDDAYLIPTGATGAWIGQTNKIATWSGASWVFYTPLTNDKTSVLTGANVGLSYTFDGTNWVVAAVPASNNFALDGNNVTSIKKLGTISNFDLPVITNNVERLRVTSTGNVGIGTTAPTAKLHVSGKSTTNTGSTVVIADDIAPSTGAGRSKLVMGNTTGISEFIVGQSPSNNMLFSWEYNATAASSFGILETYGGNNPLVLQKTGGRVGIGINAPTAKLEINNGTAGSGLKFTQLNSNSTPTTGAAPLGVDASGNVVATPGNIFLSVSGTAQPSGSNFFTVSMPTVVSAIGFPASNYNTATSLFTVPITGVYEITGTIRYTDGSPAGNQFGVGVHTSNADGPWVLWHAIQNTTNVNRRTSFPYIRVVSLTAGQVLRMYSFVDGPAMNIIDVAMQVRFLF